ncbi:hypothetical protein F4861DRAFT_538622 [Xylaria intraflava]|nr:hypothetical protein F4861DRAFT_538622 [Xylaria intraflava]
MDLEEDVEGQLNEMSRLSRLGHFSSAKRLFDENLQHRMDDPYVLVQYADLLLHQGDFKGVTLLKDDAMHTYRRELSDSKELGILRVNWDLLQIMAKSHTLDIFINVHAVFKEAVDVLTETAENYHSDSSINSTEIQIFILTFRLTRLLVLDSEWGWMPSLQKIVSDWSGSVHGYDSSTTLAMLGIMTHILLDPVKASEKECIDILDLSLPLAVLILENDPSNVKSRPYLRFLLAKSRFSETTSWETMLRLTNRLQSSQGVFYQSDIALLPMYVSAGDETPEWTQIDQAPAVADPVKLILRSVTELGDLNTKFLARKELIRLSVNLQAEFEGLCTLQLSHQGDLNGYSSTLSSRYLVSNTKPAKEKLHTSILYLLHSKISSADYLDPSHQWILQMLLYKLEGKSLSTIRQLLKEGSSDYQNITEPLLQ